MSELRDFGRQDFPDSDASESGFLSGGSLYLSQAFADIELIATSPNGHCEVYRAQRMGKWHALKCLKKEYADKEEYRALLQKEFELGYHLNHPCLVQTIGKEEIEGLGTCIVMEYVEGCTLRQAMNEGMTREQSISVLAQLCEALSYIHQRQIVHRDLKPENIMLTTNGKNVKLLDFGLSDADEYAVLKQPAGTRKYAAPEQLATGATISPLADIYTLGIIMQEMPNLSRHIKRVAKRCCKENPEERYPTANAVLNAIRQRSNTRWIWISLSFLVIIALPVALYNLSTPSMRTEVPLASNASPDVAFFLKQTAIPDDVQHEPRFVHLAEYAYSITMHFLKTQSINAKSEQEAFSYVQKEISKTMGNDSETADKYTRYLDVLTQIIAEDYRAEHFSQSATRSNIPDKEILHRIEVYVQDWVSFKYHITNSGDTGPSQTNETEVLADIEREVQHIVGKDHPSYPTYLNHARAAAQKAMGEQREWWKQSGQWQD